MTHIVSMYDLTGFTWLATLTFQYLILNKLHGSNRY